MEYGDQIELDPQIAIVVDAVGDAFVSVNLTMPPGAALSANECDQLALKLVAASAAARLRAGVIQQQMLGGATLEQAVAFADAVLGNQ